MTRLDVYIIKEVNTGENFAELATQRRLRFVTFRCFPSNVQEASTPDDLSSGLSAKLPNAMIGAASPLDPWAKRVVLKTKTDGEASAVWVSLPDLNAGFSRLVNCVCWACFSLCNEPRSCSLSSWSSMFSGAVGQLAFSASAAVVAKGKNFVANCQTNSIWKHTRSCHWFFYTEAEKYSLHSEVDLLAVESWIWLWRVALTNASHPQKIPQKMWKTGARGIPAPLAVEAVEVFFCSQGLAALSWHLWLWAAYHLEGMRRPRKDLMWPTAQLPRWYHGCMADGSVGIKLLGVNLRMPFNLSSQGFGFREVNSTFQGQSEPFFLGLIPVLTIFDELEGGDWWTGSWDESTFRTIRLFAVRKWWKSTGSLSANSAFLNSLNSILDNTKVSRLNFIKHLWAQCWGNSDFLARWQRCRVNMVPRKSLMQWQWPMLLAQHSTYCLFCCCRSFLSCFSIL